jgi:Ca-activated chloride channel homolog
MNWMWPSVLLLLLLIPAMVIAYTWVLRKRKKTTIQYSSLSLIRDALPGKSSWRRHLPFALFLVGLASLIMALARPVASVTVPYNRATIILALDVSLSMCSSDIPPNRLTVAQEAAETFIRNQEPGTQVGVVAFSGFAELIIPPTTDKDALIDAVDNLIAGRWTAIGSAILKSLDAISEVNPDVVPANVFTLPQESTTGTAVEDSLQPDIIVLLTDGASNRGADPLAAAQAADERGIRVYTIGFGTPQGSMFNCTLKQLGGFEFENNFGSGGGGFGGGFRGGFRRGLDEGTLKEIASLTGGEYYLAESADELLDVFAEVPQQLGIMKETTEVSVFFSAFGAIMAIAAGIFSQRWSPLP